MSEWEKKCWFITGASTGFGRAIAESVLSAGGRVIATARNPAALDDLVAKGAGRVTAIPLDVTDQRQIDQAMDASDAAGGFDILLNNAGYGFLGGVEESSDAEIDAQLAVNFFGPLALTRAALPRLRRRGGYIVNMSSIAGVRGSPGAALYVASKFALEGLSESLAGELAPFGVGMLIVEPGFFRTEFSGRSIMTATQPHPDYGFLAERRGHLKAVDGQQAGDPGRAGAAIFAAMNSENPPLRLLLGSDAWAMAAENLHARQSEMDRWKTVSASTDFAKPD